MSAQLPVADAAEVQLIRTGVRESTAALPLDPPADDAKAAAVNGESPANIKEFTQ
ncbi:MULTISPECIES: hypothetical protein [Streptomyces]|uniref:Uncharacterized protein n=1 Tax=Streptomyces sp. NBC_00093 TaxID=2975649 RepID=A0AAU1ZWF3_9ACTN